MTGIETGSSRPSWPLPSAAVIGVSTLVAFVLIALFVRQSRPSFEDSLRADVEQAIALLEAGRMGPGEAHEACRDGVVLRLLEREDFTVLGSAADVSVTGSPSTSGAVALSMSRDGVTYAFMIDLAEFPLYERSLAVGEANDRDAVRPDAPFATHLLAFLRETAGF